jgi:hypothetical protein
MEYKERTQQFILSSLKERILFQHFWIARDKDFTIDKISKAEKKESWDVIFTSADTKYLTEIKVRNITLQRYKKYGSKIDKKKYDYLMDTTRAAEMEGEHMVPLYAVFYQDCKLALFNLNEIPEPDFFDRQDRFYSSVTTGNPYVTKQEFDIPFEYATIYDFNILAKDWDQLAVEVANALFPNNDFHWNNLAE